jgi:homoserine dehydrogenase
MNLAVLGHGTVGSGVAEVFFKNRTALEKKAGQELDLKYILNLRDFPDLPYADRFVKDFYIIADDDSVKVVAEVIGGLEPAYTFTKTVWSAEKRGNLQ